MYCMFPSIFVLSQLSIGLSDISTSSILRAHYLPRGMYENCCKFRMDSGIVDLFFFTIIGVAVNFICKTKNEVAKTVSYFVKLIQKRST